MIATHASTDTRTLTLLDPPEPEGATPPNLGGVYENLGSLVDGDPFFYVEANGDVTVDIGELLALEFRVHRSGQLRSLLRSTHMEDLTTVFVVEVVTDAGDVDALNEARIRHLWLGANKTSWRCTEGSFEFPDGSDLSPLTSVCNPEVRGVDFTDDHLQNLGSPWSLESLELDGATVSPAALERFIHLRGLDISGAVTFGNDLAFLDRLRHLEAVGIRFSGLADAKQIVLLDISGTGVDDTTIGTLAQNRKISILKMQCTDLTDRGLEALRALPQITHLNVAGTQITDTGLQTSVQALPWLTPLDIRATDVTPGGAKVLSDLEHIWSLGLSDPLLTVDCTTHVRYERSVTELIVGVGMLETNDEQAAAFEVIECSCFPRAPG